MENVCDTIRVLEAEETRDATTYSEFEWSDIFKSWKAHRYMYFVSQWNEHNKSKNTIWECIKDIFIVLFSLYFPKDTYMWLAGEWKFIQCPSSLEI